MKLAHVHVGERSSPVQPDGTFAVEGVRRGFVVVRFTGVHHEARELGLWVPRDEQLEVKLGTYARDDGGLEHATVVLHRRANGAITAATQVRLQRATTGAWSADVRGAGMEIIYQLRGLVPMRDVDGPEADSFEYDGGGDYFSILSPQPSPRTVHVDPTLLPPAAKPFEVRFAEPDGSTARIASLWQRAAARVEDDAKGRPVDASFRADITRALATEHDPDVVSALRIAYLVPAPVRSDEAASVARQLLDALPADASLWAFRPEAALDAVELAGRNPEREAYLDRLLDGLADHDAAARLLASRVRAASLAGREDELARLWAILRERFGGTPAARAAAIYEPSRKIRPGREVPDFDLGAMTDPRTRPGTHVTRTTLRGKVTLIDFWGTWCMPCRAEVKFLEQAYSRHSAQGFVIVSIAAHDRADAVANFRRSISPMPWTHVVLDAAKEDDALQMFETRSFPSSILVSREGRIVAVGDELRGERLERAVSGALLSGSRVGTTQP
jgi:thiol-disulfide isomerase/thioredoxin